MTIRDTISTIMTIDHICLEPPADGEIVDPMDWFDSPGPLEIEIGCGKGGFLLSRAKANPDIRMLGIEWANKYYRYCADRMARWQLTNVRVMRTDASHFVINHLPPDCLSVLHLYHPDPWPKKRHHKRRLVQSAFIEATIRSLQQGGYWRIQTDHQEYFEHIQALLSTRPELTETPWEDVDLEAGSEWEGTNFEIKYSRENRAIYRLIYQRTSSAGTIKLQP